MRFSRIPLQLVLGPSSSRSYLCIKIRETPLLHRLRPCPKKFHRRFPSLETSGRHPETDGKEADGLATDVLRAVDMLVVIWPWSPCRFAVCFNVDWLRIASSGIASSAVQKGFAAVAVSNTLRPHSCHEQGGKDEAHEVGHSMHRREGT